MDDTVDTPAGIAKFIAHNPGLSFVAVDVTGRDDEEAGLAGGAPAVGALAGARPDLQVGDGRLVGTLLTGHDTRAAQMYHLAVAEGYQGRGIARSLVERSIAALKADGVTWINFAVYANNQTGLAFWDKVGFEYRPDLEYRNFIIE